MSEPLDRVARWDERYAGREYLWDVTPNRFVERFLADLAPGTAIDLAGGEGRNAVWLARRGWQVTLVDFSQVGLDKAARLAADNGVAQRVDIVNADVLAWHPAGPVDLVLVAYLQIPAADQRLVLERAAAWLRADGLVFVVAHDRSNVEHGHGGPSDPSCCYDLDETVTALAGLQLVRAEIARREVETEGGLRIALDTLVCARRPPA